MQPDLRRHIERFTSTIWSDWIALLSGIASVVLAFLGELARNSVALGKSLWVAAAACVIVAAFRAWRKERLRVEELERRFQPKLELVFAQDEKPFVQETLYRLDDEMGAHERRYRVGVR